LKLSKNLAAKFENLAAKFQVQLSQTIVADDLNLPKPQLCQGDAVHSVERTTLVNEQIMFTCGAVMR
jgi:hypothetical protein